MASPQWNQTASLTDPISLGSDGSAVSPSDSVNLDPPAKGVCVTDITAGSNLSIVTLAGNTIPFVSVSVGFVPPYHVKRVNSTGTTCTVYTID